MAWKSRGPLSGARDPFDGGTVLKVVLVLVAIATAYAAFKGWL